MPFTVRLFEIDREGKLEPLLGVDEDFFAGAVPNVGDTYSAWGADGYAFYSVQRRVFVNSSDGESGWLVIVRKIEAAPLLESVVEAWFEDNHFWREAAEQERLEEQELKSQETGSYEHWKRKNDERKKHAPIHKLHAPQMRALRFLIDHPDCRTVDLIPRTGEKTMEALEAKGCVRAGAKDHRGNREWYVTDEGRAEVKRAETFANWVFD